MIAAKQSLRARLLAARRERPADQRTAAQDANTRHLLALTAGSDTVCAFLPLATEPLGRGLLDRLDDAGIRVLVPVVVGAEPLDWTDYSAARTAGRTPTAGPLGIPRLAGPRLGPAVAAAAAAILVPALAVDPQGYRLGRGGGHYDRTLALVAAQARRRQVVIGVVYDSERLPHVPHDTFDRPVAMLVAPEAGPVDLR